MLRLGSLRSDFAGFLFIFMVRYFHIFVMMNGSEASYSLSYD
nr:MAG TPA: hypothetical protein [Caudoviricetes sp.]